MNVFSIAKVGVHIMSVLGVSKVINDVIALNTTVVTPADSVKVAAGSLVLGSLVVDAASDHIEDRFTEITNWWEKRKSKNEETTLVPEGA